MSIIFINREEELEFLKDLYKKKGSKLVIVYGRRRLGKTELLKKFTKDLKGIYFLADRRGTSQNVERFRSRVEESLNLPPLRVENFDGIFDQISRNKDDSIVVIDEFTYLIEEDASIVSVFQLIYDEILKGKTNIFLILSGSYVSMMETEVLSYRSPLYGRRDGQIKLERFKIKDMAKMLSNYSLEDIIRTYAILDSIPGYLDFFDSKKSILENLTDTILNKKHMLYLEPEILLKQELKNPTNYLNIIEAISKGKTKALDISNKSRVPFPDLPKYMNILMNLGFVSKVHPVTVKKEKSKKIRYHLTDNFFRFWFRFIAPNKSLIEFGEIKPVLKKIDSQLDDFVSFAFERVCKEALTLMNVRGELPFTAQRIGREWGKIPSIKETYELDLVALNEKTKDIFFGECKWSENVDAYRLLEDTKRKAVYVDWNKEKRTEHYFIFAKSFREKFREEDVRLIDLKDLKRILTK
jgi:AAA+ ATPase superfamily predicted ATPase